MQTLLNYGFNQQDINNLMYAYNFSGKVTMAILQQMGCSYEQAQRLNYANNIYMGKVILDSIPKLAKHFRIVYGCTQEEANKMAYSYNLQSGNVDTKEGLISHLKKINKDSMKITINDLAVSKINNVPRVAVVANINQEPYNIWNSKNYNGADALYKVVDVTSQKITIETAKKPKLPYKSAMKLPGILEIQGVKSNGNAVVAFNRDYCKLCNRFIIVASLRSPEFHLGMYEMVCFEGTKVYIYATNMGTKETVRYNMGNQRVYDYGIFPNTIKVKLDKVAKNMYQYLKGVRVEYRDANSEYVVVPAVQKLDNEDEGLEM